ncbi:hypothetical protein OsI_32005 [Oryza sativa Indica Group]|uniref:Uncharacterized protein n=1 Tax=Oryza sativa subsp. indica TaxID=39946 RepID=A2Z308_ORYSI|nr:hypothetical protein OsI_32005 [Oryza sativa Indica Group]
MEPTGAGAGVIQCWETLPEDLLVTVFCQLEIPDLLRSGAVCASWHAAYRTFRRLRLPSPKQPPCLLYSCDAYGPDAAGLYCPSTGATYRIPVSCGGGGGGFRNLTLIGSADGWVVAADEIGNLRLLNPLTGAHAELPPLSTMHHFEAAADEEDEGGGLAYDIVDRLYNRPSLVRVPAREVRDCMYFRAVLSCGPHADAGGGDAAACVVLLLHMSRCELSYARPGDERWTWISPGAGTGLRWRNLYCDAAYCKDDGLFYVVRDDDSVHALDLTGPSPVARKVFDERPWSTSLPSRYLEDVHLPCAQPCRYLVNTPSGELLHVWRFRQWVSSYDSSSDDQDDSSNDSSSEDQDDSSYDSSSEDQDSSSSRDLYEDLITRDIQLYRTDFHGKKLDAMDSLDNHALFLGYNTSLCLPTEDFPGLKPNHAYITDDSLEFVNYFKRNKKEIGMWNIESQILKRFGDESSLEEPWLNWPAPIWIIPSLL